VIFQYYSVGMSALKKCQKFTLFSGHRVRISPVEVNPGKVRGFVVKPSEHEKEDYPQGVNIYGRLIGFRAGKHVTH
jgi:hypothetical protein